MNIVFLTREYPPELHGGIGTYTYVMAQALASAGHNVHVIAWTSELPRTTSDGVVQVHWIRPHLVKVLCQRPLRWLHLYDYFRATGDWIGWAFAAYQQVAEINGETGVDIVEAPDNAAGGYICSFLRDIPLVVKLHSPRTITYEETGHKLVKDDWLGLRFEKWTAHRAALIASPSQALADLLTRRWNLNRRKIRVIPYGIDSERFTPSATISDSQSMRVLYTGSLGHSKGTRVLLDAFASVLRSVPQAELVLVGHMRGDLDIEEPTYADYVLKRWGQGVASRVQFAGRVPREALVPEYRAAALTVVPSVGFENFPNTCLEAMACARPVVGSNSGGIPEMIEDGVTGLIVPAGDANALAEAIIELLQDPARAESMGRAGRERVERLYAQSKIVEETISAYQEAISRKRGEAR